MMNLLWMIISTLGIIVWSITVSVLHLWLHTRCMLMSVHCLIGFFRMACLRLTLIKLFFFFLTGVNLLH